MHSSWRRNRLRPLTSRRAILDLLAQRSPTVSVCPSEIARLHGGEQWRALMEPVRQAAARLVADGEVEITQAGKVVDLATAKGPIRIRPAR